MTDRLTLRQRAEEGARKAICTFHSTNGFCTGENPDCLHCGRIGAHVGRAVLQHIRPTLKRLLDERQRAHTTDEVLALIDEAVG